ncbi:hypothetical protein LQ327_06885 [Actinomycetospora endophytica]|uniref:Glycoprotein n=1 Tax=Actinomycetospora endophytica TaxID=2291215 RepID=A0ABS8P4E2_9PSEU|nr:hypothetical protein [Actinomycetospora endophytica]MCD2193113.1 hypothetical protein [Actinomycetospora endophytica]
MIPRGPAAGADRVLVRGGAVLVVGVVAALVLLLPGLAAAQDATPGSVTLTLDSTVPRIVTSDGPPELVVTGHVDNHGATPVRDVGVRVQRGDSVATDREVGHALDGSVSADGPGGAAPAFTPVAEELDPEADVPFTVRVPLRGPADSSLALATPGVYPLVVDVNGTPGTAGAPARVASDRMLLPVTGVPGGAGAPVPAPGRAPTTSVLWPLADQPRRLPVPPGAPALLADDSLATSFAPGGRLEGLVAALDRSAPLGSPAAASVCLAVDADLLETAADMSGGYQVRTPTGSRPGAGAAAAGAWLASVRDAARGRCVVALPYANADLLATSRGNMSDLTTAARTLGERRVADLLGTPVVPDATVPAGGLVDERSLADLAGGGARSLVLDGATLAGGVPPGAVGRFAGESGAAPLALATDPLAREALAPRPTASDGSTSPAGTGAGLSTEDALGVVTLRALAPTPVPATTVLAPPADWAANEAEASALLSGVGDLARRGLTVPVDAGTLLTTGAARGAALPPVVLGPGDRSGVSDQSTAVLDEIRGVRDDQRDLLAASRQDHTGAPTPSDYVEPLTGALLRSLSAAGRGEPALQQAAANDVAAQMHTLRGLVRVVQPAGTYSLGSSDAPLLLTVENQLPVAVDVTVALEPTPGVRVSPVPVRQVPAFGSVQFQVALDVGRSGQFTVDATARTPGGDSLGPTSRLLLRSTAYGTITVWLTASAAVVLVTLASLRVARRVRRARQDRRSRPSPRHATGPIPTVDPDGTATTGTGPTTGGAAQDGDTSTGGPGRQLQDR